MMRARTQDGSELWDKLTFLDTVATATGDGLFAFDRALRCIFWNGKMAALSGMSEREVVGRSVHEAFPTTDRIMAGTVFEDAVAGKFATRKNRRYATPETRELRLFDVYCFPVLSRAGDVLSGAALVRDVTENKIAEQQAKETELRFKNMADASPVLLWMSDTDGLCTFFNQTWLDFTGRPLEAEWGVGWAEGLHFEDFQFAMDTYTEAFNQRRRFEMEYRLRRSDGAYRWILDRGVPRFTPEGHFAGYIGSCVDITERKGVESELRRAVRDRDEFLSIAAHELRTPLTSLKLQVESLVATLELQEIGETGLERAKKNANRAARQTSRIVGLIEQLLDLSRLTVGKLELQTETMDLRAVVADVVERMTDLARGGDSELRLVAPDPVVGDWDRCRLDQVVNNLLVNALKYGQGHAVEIGVARQDGHALLTVVDHGPGIAQEDQSRIFERFERAVSSRNFGGFGLGLWISRQLVEAHGGRIWVESSPGDGATFFVELRAAAPP